MVRRNRHSSASGFCRRSARGRTHAARVLAVGQSEHVRLWACRQLRKAGFTVITTDDGVDALILAHGDPPDLILTDDDVGRLDVRYLLMLLRRDVRTAGTPVLLITPRTDGDLARDCRALGATLVVKPGVRSPAGSAAATVASASLRERARNA